MWGKLFEDWSKNTQRGWEGNQEGRQQCPLGGWRGPQGSRHTTMPSPSWRSWISKELLMFARSSKLPYGFVWTDTEENAINWKLSFDLIPKHCGPCCGSNRTTSAEPLKHSLSAQTAESRWPGGKPFSSCVVFRESKTPYTSHNLNSVTFPSTRWGTRVV